jgi:hypothetical protein
MADLSDYPKGTDFGLKAVEALVNMTSARGQRRDQDADYLFKKALILAVLEVAAAIRSSQ